jgi:hypothetical protein
MLLEVQQGPRALAYQESVARIQQTVTIIIKVIIPSGLIQGRLRVLQCWSLHLLLRTDSPFCRQTFYPHLPLRRD